MRMFVLGPILFFIYVNNLEEGVASKILKFAVDSKHFGKLREIVINNNYWMILINLISGLKN